VVEQGDVPKGKLRVGEGNECHHWIIGKRAAPTAPRSCRGSPGGAEEFGWERRHYGFFVLQSQAPLNAALLRSEAAAGGGERGMAAEDFKNLLTAG